MSRMKTIAFATVKGGVGKSSIAIQTAKNLSEESRVLMIDLDPQSAATSHLAPEKIPGTIRQVLKEEMNIRDVIIPVCPNFDFIPSEIELSLSEAELSNSPNPAFLLYEFLHDSGLGEEYDYCVIDSPGAVGILMNTAIITSDVTVIPTQLETWSVRAIKATKQVIATCRRSKKLIGQGIKEIIVANMWENRSVKNFYRDELKKDFSDIFYPKPLPYRADISVTFSEAGGFINTNSQYYPDFKDFSDYLKGVING
ncbi:MAG: ParA family protein [Brevinematales bacterium]|nr:ParA family protein [Brevinematales bacterium]